MAQVHFFLIFWGKKCFTIKITKYSTPSTDYEIFYFYFFSSLRYGIISWTFPIISTFLRLEFLSQNFQQILFLYKKWEKSRKCGNHSNRTGIVYEIYFNLIFHVRTRKKNILSSIAVELKLIMILAFLRCLLGNFFLSNLNVFSFFLLV